MNETVTITLDARQAKQWVMMQFLDSVGAFDVKLGRVTIDFDAQGQIGNCKIEQNYKLGHNSETNVNTKTLAHICSERYNISEK